MRAPGARHGPLALEPDLWQMAWMHSTVTHHAKLQRREVSHRNPWDPGVHAQAARRWCWTGARWRAGRSATTTC